MKIDRKKISECFSNGLLVNTPYLLLFFALLVGGCVDKPQPKPNILWITIEDTSPQFLGCYGNLNASTPVIDKLAEEGVRFCQCIFHWNGLFTKPNGHHYWCQSLRNRDRKSQEQISNS
jgi:hypothetical protein